MNKRKNIFVINPHHYCHSVASLIEGLNKIDDVKVFSNSFQNYVLSPATQLKSQIQLAKASDIVVLTHSALESKYNQIIGPLLNEVEVEYVLKEMDVLKNINKRFLYSY